MKNYRISLFSSKNNYGVEILPSVSFRRSVMSYADGKPIGFDYHIQISWLVFGYIISWVK